MQEALLSIKEVSDGMPVVTKPKWMLPSGCCIEYVLQPEDPAVAVEPMATSSQFFKKGSSSKCTNHWIEAALISILAWDYA